MWILSTVCERHWCAIEHLALPWQPPWKEKGTDRRPLSSPTLSLCTLHREVDADEHRGVHRGTTDRTEIRSQSRSLPFAARGGSESSPCHFYLKNNNNKANKEIQQSKAEFSSLNLVSVSKCSKWSSVNVTPVFSSLQNATTTWCFPENLLFANATMLLSFILFTDICG